MGPITAPPPRWVWWAPTPMSPVATPPLRSVGGASLLPDPWQLLQSLLDSKMPLMCRPPPTSMVLSPSTVPGWQVSQSALGGWGAGGGEPWQVPQAAWVPFTVVQVGVWMVPPALSVLPWQ